MTRENYEDLLESLGYNPAHFGKSHLLRHPSNRHLPRVYMNTRDGNVFFTVFREESHHYPESLWQRIDQTTVPTAKHMEVVPIRGKEIAAFEDLAKRTLARPATYRT